MDSERSSTDDETYSEGSQASSSESFETPEAVDKAIALFRQATVAAYVKRTVALFAMIGLGLGIAGYLILSLMLEGGGFLDVTLGFVLAMIVLLFVAFLGAALAAVIATEAWTTLDRPLVETCLICGASCYAGVFVMIVVSIVLVRGGFPPIVAAEFNTGRLLVLAVVTSLPAALVSPGVVWIDRRYLGVRGWPSEEGP